MALSFVDTSGNLYIPGAYPAWEVAPSTSGTSTTGVVVLVGEADSGPDFTSDNVVENGYGPNSKASVIAKYGSGRLVDAYLQACKPSKDPGVRGSPARIFLVKTNKGTAAEGALGAYATLQARLEGVDGNLIQAAVKAHSDAAKRIVTIVRKLDGVSESFTIGGNVGLSVTASASASFTVTATGITSAGAGAGAVAALNVLFAQFKTLRDLAAYISAQAGWTATVASAFGQKNPKVLDRATYSIVIGGDTPAPTATVKMDAYEFVTALNGSRVVKVKTAPVSGLPTITSNPVYLSTGARGASADSDFIAAFAACRRIQGNFVVPLVSQDASSDDETDTDSTSSYTVAGVNAALADHIATCSQFKQRKPRQGFPSFRGSYVNSKSGAQNMAYARCALPFLDVNVSGQNGLGWFQPWMGAVTAAAMQAAAFYKPAFGKQLNISGVRHAAGEFFVEEYDQVEDALMAGLLVIGPKQGGGFEFVSDQTTYGVDSTFVLNSFQAVYVADVISMTVAMKMENAFKGQNFADVTSGVALSFFKSVMSDMRKLKLVASSADAPAGYKDVNINIKPPAMVVSAEVKEATGLYFIPIRFLITQSEQTATA